MANKLTLKQKRALYRDGYIILKNAIPRDLIEPALAQIARKDESSHNDTYKQE